MHGRRDDEELCGKVEGDILTKGEKYGRYGLRNFGESGENNWFIFRYAENLGSELDLRAAVLANYSVKIRIVEFAIIFWLMQRALREV